MIVFASMLLFHDPVSGLQFIGFTIALAGLLYYQIGGTPVFVGYWTALRARFGSKKTGSNTEIQLDSVEAQGLLNGSSEPFPVTKHVA